MPIENWGRLKNRFTKNDEKARREWSQGNIIGVGKDVDPAVREFLRNEETSAPETPKNSEEGTNSFWDPYN
jgi:hypothetical protein